MAIETTPVSGGELIERLHIIADALYGDLKRDAPKGDRAFEIRIHTLILMLKRFEAKMKRGG